MSARNPVPVERFPQSFPFCSHGPAEEIGWFGLINEDDPANEDLRRVRNVPDSERRFLRKLSDQWRTVQNLDLDNAAADVPPNRELSYIVGEWRPLFHMRSWIKNNREQFDNFRPNIVSTARTLRLLLEAPNYISDRNRDTYQYVVCKRRDTIYLSRSKVCPQNNQPETPAESDRLYYMERFLTAPSDGGDPEHGTSSLNYFFSVLGRTFDNIKVLSTQQIDCMDPTHPSTISPPANYVKLASVKRDTSIPRNLPYCHWHEQNPYRAAWAKSFVGGFPKAILGIRNGSILERCEMIQTADIPDKTNCSKPRCYRHWDKERNVSFLKEFLELVQHTVKENYDRAVYGFRFDLSGRETLKIHTTEWSAGSQNFEENNILRMWGGEEFWNHM